jgi:hypothetical protein
VVCSDQGLPGVPSKSFISRRNPIDFSNTPSSSGAGHLVAQRRASGGPRRAGSPDAGRTPATGAIERLQWVTEVGGSQARAGAALSTPYGPPWSSAARSASSSSAVGRGSATFPSLSTIDHTAGAFPWRCARERGGRRPCVWFLGRRRARDPGRVRSTDRRGTRTASVLSTLVLAALGGPAQANAGSGPAFSRRRQRA